MKEKIAVICPGRGTYNAAELGYFSKHHPHREEFLSMLDALRSENGQLPVSQLDGAARYSLARHTSSENASLLIFACAMADFMAIDRDRFEIVAVTGNSMGWYLALTAGGALGLEDGARLVNTMGTLMQAEGKGGQVVWPLIDENWHPDTGRIALADGLLAEAAERDDLSVHVSIRLGGLMIFAADEAGIAFLQEKLPAEDRYPMVLANHAGFHSPLLDHVPPLAKAKLSADLFQTPDIPLIDGRGGHWSPWSADAAALHDYTLGAQINLPYNFTRAVEVTLKEFAPDRLVIPGPGTTLGGAVAQILVANGWQGIDSKATFKARQASDPFLISMGLDDQRNLVV